MTAALRIVDEGALDALTMRRPADADKLQLPAIYRMFSNKRALLDEMAEAIPATALPDTPENQWEAEVTLVARQLRQALLAQREGARIVGGSYAAKRHSLTLAERLVGVMRRAGFNGVAALWATSTVFCYVLGEALEQQGLTDDARDRLTFPGARETYPHLFSTPVEEILNFDDRFEFGLGLILGGLRGQLPR
ncbi:TetR/AcrR family transcriptional regulator C-terminal domain-containing protein [Streptomyces sp. MBT65]|uniref:TetR/AcrR family transcriptional regulator C-terminal domain-containing protein n=1 Tax=Streptomyces sp. MBT65 TaxID=1488395 RepID=UPI00190A3BF5|nr:TetR/AcrR family transcriptional regulator C-terminal domain-containing protein [Streptomyces sp. MBT65]MBK3574512.1 TetR/AcrR family transcriptional regulator C-terminal domain-containing protein [Streptomyces sp. MBT65]